ncbi:SubName: Full=Uncharacterized protein {ECO:0000313/EMBL:CCA69551.1} [Serendipita indica DSM 11827]|uniref:Peptidase M50B-like-domain-containing protein n=1 Tax=Serendipita indica (strain DSM 11827) TaxID=1109443 RepID=G4TDY3_SERID|nr:SubName: Full=Uncharacterized protein {ECO:0000313/EMBL:CCA69551.1} [Serendipita indica DSM 11827]CCA69551.1 hypothetical protein PIIN_03490 [Serendipita indica DSM 11827]
MPRVVAPASQTETSTPEDRRLEVIYSSVVFLIVAFAFWTFPVVRVVINPLKLFVIGWHEFCHIAVAILTGGTILSISIDPNLGGACEIEGGWAPAILSAGYFGSLGFGGALILGGWDILVAKILSFFIAFGLLMPLSLVRDKITIILTIIYEALLIAFWFIDHGNALRWYCLLLGILTVLYPFWDLIDERFKKKQNTSDITQYAVLFEGTPRVMWIWIWCFLSTATLVGFCAIGYTKFDLNSDQMYAQGNSFLPT